MEKELVFEELPINKRQRRGWNAKAWIALGVIMLVVGLQLFGWADEEQPIRVREKDMRGWAKKLTEEGPDTINIKMKNRVSNIENQKLTEG